MLRDFRVAGPLLAAGLAVLAGCSVLPWELPRRVELPPPVMKKITVVQTRVPGKNELPGLIGRPQQHRVAEKETLLDVARNAGLGFHELKDANRYVDEWIPPPGLDVDVPTQWIVPQSSYRGVVINIPEMRLYMFPRKTRAGEVVNVRTWPIGIGLDDKPSPVGPFRVTAKDKNPTWYVPDSIYETMDPPKRRIVPPGPDNPLGAYRIRLSKGAYAIHGTNTPWSVGRLTTHGCIRLYPEDIGELFDLVGPGSSGELIYQPIKFGQHDGEIFVEVHGDVYKRFRNFEGEAFRLAKRAKLAHRIDSERLRQAVRERRGVPVAITRQTPPLSDKVASGGSP